MIRAGTTITGTAAERIGLAPIRAGQVFAETDTGALYIANEVPAWQYYPSLIPGPITVEGNLTLDDGVGDSPRLRFIGGSNGDVIYIHLVDDPIAGRSDLALVLADAAGESELTFLDSALATVATIDSNGNAIFSGHMGVGGGAAYYPDFILGVTETFVVNAGLKIGFYAVADFVPTGNFTTSIYGAAYGVRLLAAQARTGGLLVGQQSYVSVGNGIVATALQIQGLNIYVDIQDAGAVVAYGAYIETPRVDTGSCTTGFGIRIVQGAVGAGSITTLYGLFIDSIVNGNTNYAIYSVGGNSYHGGIFNIAGGVRTITVNDNVSNPPTDAELDAAFGAPAAVGDGYIGLVDDAGAGTTVWLCVAFNSKWWYEELTEAL